MTSQGAKREGNSDQILLKEDRVLKDSQKYNLYQRGKKKRKRKNAEG